MKKKILSLMGVFIFSLALTLSISNNVNRNDAIDSTLKAISIGASAQAEDESTHGRPLLWSPTLGYKCDSCTGTDCAAAC